MPRTIAGRTLFNIEVQAIRGGERVTVASWQRFSVDEETARKDAAVVARREFPIDRLFVYTTEAAS